MNEESKVVSVRMSQETKDLMDKFIMSGPFKQTDIIGLILSWFVRQDKSLQAVILGLVKDEVMERI